MIPITPTDRFAIEKILLAACSFRADLDRLVAASAQIRLTVTSSVKHRDEPSLANDRRFSCVVEVGVEADLDGAKLVEGRVAYVGWFRWAEGSPLVEDAARNTMAPAYLYNFCREHIADLGRRCGLQLMLPPTRLSRPLEGDRMSGG
jgi:preprotein translocase subunit SecB